MDERHPPQVGGGDVAGEVADHPAAEGEHRVAALGPLPGEPGVELGGDRELLRALARGDDVGGAGDAGLVEHLRHAPAVEPYDLRVGDDEHAPAEAEHPEPVGEPLELPGPHPHRVALAHGVDDGGRRPRRRLRAEAVAPALVGERLRRALRPQHEDPRGGLGRGERLHRDPGVGVRVEGAPLLLELEEAPLDVPREQGALARAGGLPQAIGDHPRRRVEVAEEAVLAEGAARAGGEEGPPAGRDHRRGAARRLHDDALLDAAEGGLAAGDDELGRRPPLALGDEIVGVQERPAEALGEHGADRGLPDPREADQDQLSRGVHSAGSSVSCWPACSPGRGPSPGRRGPTLSLKAS